MRLNAPLAHNLIVYNVASLNPAMGINEVLPGFDADRNSNRIDQTRGLSTDAV